MIRFSNGPDGHTALEYNGSEKVAVGVVMSTHFEERLRACLAGASNGMMGYISQPEGAMLLEALAVYRGQAVKAHIEQQQREALMVSGHGIGIAGLRAAGLGHIQTSRAGQFDVNSAEALSAKQRELDTIGAAIAETSGTSSVEAEDSGIDLEDEAIDPANPEYDPTTNGE